MRELTERQEQVLETIRAHIREHGVPPNRVEIAHKLGLADASSVTGHLKRLQATGRIELLGRTPRGIRVLDEAVPLVRPLAEVAAGTPIVCDAHIVERVPAAIAHRFRPRPDYLVTVRGDSMDRTGLRDRDIVAIHRTPEAERPGRGRQVRRRGDAEAVRPDRRAPRGAAAGAPQPGPPRDEAGPGEAHPADRGHRSRGAHRRAARRRPGRRSGQGRVTGPPSEDRHEATEGGQRGTGGRDAGRDAGGVAVAPRPDRQAGRWSRCRRPINPPAPGAGHACGPPDRVSPRGAECGLAAGVARTNTAAGPSGRAGRRMARLLDPASSGARATDPRRRPARPGTGSGAARTLDGPAGDLREGRHSDACVAPGARGADVDAGRRLRAGEPVRSELAREGQRRGGASPPPGGRGRQPDLQRQFEPAPASGGP